MLLVPTRLAQSTIHGLGVFALAPILKGTAVWRFEQGLDMEFAPDIVDRLPIRVLGAVLNGVPGGGAYRYYGTNYYYGDTRAKEHVGNLATPKGLLLNA